MTAESEYHSNFADGRANGGDALCRADAPGHGTGQGQSDPFSRIDWFSALHSQCLQETAPLIVKRVTDTGDDGAAWLFLTGDGSGHVRAMSNWYSFAWQPVFDRVPADQRMTVLTAMFADLRDRAHRLTLGPVPTENGIAAMVQAALNAAGWTTHVDNDGHNHWLDTDGRTFDTWWAQRPGALRSTVQRKGKKGLVALTITDQFDDGHWDAYEAVYQQSWKPDEASPAFLRNWARTEAAAGNLRMGLAHVDGVPVAAQFWTCDAGVAYIHKLAHVSGHDALSPGTLLTHALFAHAFDVDRVRRIDFGTGDDGYKRDWMEQSAPLSTIHAWDSRQPAAWPNLLRHHFSRLAAGATGR